MGSRGSPERSLRSHKGVQRGTAGVTRRLLGSAEGVVIKQLVLFGSSIDRELIQTVPIGLLMVADRVLKGPRGESREGDP
jgi:hypothetical protein